MPTDTVQPVGPDWLLPGGDETPPAPPEEPTHRGAAGPGRRGVSGALALLLVGVAAGGLTAHQLWHPHSAATTTTVSPAAGGAGSLPAVPTGPRGNSGTGASGPANAAAIAQTVDPAVVDINTTIGYQNAQAAGTGMVLTSTGEVLTNNHVISGATSISVTDVGNGRTYKAIVVGYSKSNDVAVLQLQGASGLTTIRTSTQAAQTGDAVVAIGNAGGAGGTPSYAAGAITAVDQSITASDSGDGTSQRLTGLLQTDANIVAGDSGGPLVNAQGAVVGMDTAASAGFRFSQSSTGFAIPIATALQLARQIESGSASDSVHIGPTAMLGVGVQPDSSSSGSQSSGAVIAQVVTGGPAATAGLSAGDTIVAVGGHSVASADDLSNAVLQLTPGHSVSVAYVDTTGVHRSVTLHLAVGPPQ
jgi:S1-C subfamily serine protease